MAEALWVYVCSASSSDGKITGPPATFHTRNGAGERRRREKEEEEKLSRWKRRNGKEEEKGGKGK